MNGIKKFADFADEPVGLDGEKIQMDRVLNHDIVVTGHRILASKYPGKNKSGYALQLQFKVLVTNKTLNSEQLYVLFTGSDVLIDQITKYAEHIPFCAKIVKINRYYTFQ